MKSIHLKASALLRSIALLMFLSLSSLNTFAQEKAEMADTMRSNGKIYVLVAVMLILLGGIATYLVVLDRKISRLEKKYEDNL
jgi:CcmD family protein